MSGGVRSRQAAVNLSDGAHGVPTAFPTDGAIKQNTETSPNGYD